MTITDKMQIQGFESLVQAINGLSPSTAEAIGEILWARTPAEISASVTPTNYAYPPGNVLRYGTNAIPGTTNMTSAINTALSCNDVVFLPAGTYAISQLVITGSGNDAIFGKYLVGEGSTTYLKGISAGTSMIRFGTSGGWADETNLQEYRADSCGLVNIGLYATAAYTYGIECQWLTNSVMDNVTISQGSTITTAMYLDFSWDNDFYHFISSGTNGISCGSNSPNNNRFHGLRLGGASLGGVGFNVTGSGNCVFGFDISGFTSGVKSGGGFGLLMEGGYFESNTYDVNLGDGSITGCKIQAIFGAGVGANVGIRHNGGGGNVREVDLTGSCFRLKDDGVILTSSCAGWKLPGYNAFESCTRTITFAGSSHEINIEDTFTPSFTGLTVVLGGGSVTYTGTYTRIGRMVNYTIVITPAGGATTASTLNTTYCSNLPFTSKSGFPYVDMNTRHGDFTSIAGGGVAANTTRVYTPTWAADTSGKIISGSYESAA